MPRWWRATSKRSRSWASWFRHPMGRIQRQAERSAAGSYSTDSELKGLIRSYNDPLIGYNARMDYKFFMHSKNYF
jgi:hypothetical protein